MNVQDIFDMKALKKIRSRVGVGQRAIARRLKISPQAYAYYEKAPMQRAVRVLMAVYDMSDLTPEEFVALLRREAKTP